MINEEETSELIHVNELFDFLHKRLSNFDPEERRDELEKSWDNGFKDALDEIKKAIHKRTIPRHVPEPPRGVLLQVGMKLETLQGASQPAHDTLMFTGNRMVKIINGNHLVLQSKDERIVEMFSIVEEWSEDQ